MKGIRILMAFAVLVMPIYIMAETYTVEVGQFQKLKINSELNVVYKNLPDSTGFARFNAGTGNQDMFKFESKGDGTLKVSPSDENWGKTDLPVLYLYSDFLTSVESYSSLSVDIESVAPCASFNATLVGNGSIIVNDLKCNAVNAKISTGNGTIYLSGDCVTANYRMVGAGMISADRLSAETVKCRILGTGSIGCWPVDNLSVSGIGSTKIYYKGRPNIKKTGGGKLFELPEDDIPRRGVEIKSFNLPEQTVVTEEDD